MTQPAETCIFCRRHCWSPHRVEGEYICEACFSRISAPYLRPQEFLVPIGFRRSVLVRCLLGSAIGAVVAGLLIRWLIG